METPLFAQPEGNELVKLEGFIKKQSTRNYLGEYVVTRESEEYVLESPLTRRQAEAKLSSLSERFPGSTLTIKPFTMPKLAARTRAHVRAW